MTEGKDCPFCGAKSARSCPHLALVAKPTDFVERCIENSQGESFWQLLVNNRGNPLLLHRFGGDDFLSLETSFSALFLERLGWFGKMEYEWRKAGTASLREMWVLLWSNEPLRLWWQLRDELERRTKSFTRNGEPSLAGLEKDEQAEGSRVLCPVCGQDNMEEECPHLAFHGDDLRTKAVLEECVPEATLTMLTAQQPEFVPEFASDFFDKFRDQFPSLVEASSVGWEGGGPGCSGIYVYVWAKHEVKLLNEIDAFLERKLAELRGQQANTNPSQTKKAKAHPHRAKGTVSRRKNG